MNKLHEDGRIYSHGDGVSETISPYSPDFWDNIEADIKPLVQAFVDKGYLPYSSCAGHTFEKRRFIALAFDSESSANLFVSAFSPLEREAGFDIVDFKIKDPVNDYEHDNEIDEMSQVNFLNQMYMRGYHEYRMVEISIGLNSHDEPELTKRKKFYRDIITKRIVEFVNKDLIYYGM